MVCNVNLSRQYSRFLKEATVWFSLVWHRSVYSFGNDWGASWEGEKESRSMKYFSRHPKHTCCQLHFLFSKAAMLFLDNWLFQELLRAQSILKLVGWGTFSTFGVHYHYLLVAISKIVWSEMVVKNSISPLVDHQ